MAISFNINFNCEIEISQLSNVAKSNFVFAFKNRYLSPKVVQSRALNLDRQGHFDIYRYCHK
jgi:hypothetical protein